VSLEKVRPWGHLDWPNRISLLRLLLVAPFVVLLMNQNTPDWRGWARHAALGVFVLMAISDFVDGVLARKLNARSRLGAILDPLADKTLVIVAVVLLSISDFQVPGHRVHNWMVVVAVAKDLWVVAGFIVIYLVTDRFLVRPTLAGKAATFAICVLVPVVLISPELDDLASGLGRHVVLALEAAATVLCILAVISYTKVGLEFVARREKPLEDDPADAARNREQH
jgi:CDP-diacylglycerol--glycerol-3-phosphate 3-phosphatidyltransferase